MSPHPPNGKESEDHKIRLLAARGKWSGTDLSPMRRRMQRALSTLQRHADGAFKRFVDIVVSGVVLSLLSPFFLAIAIAIKLTDWGPVLFWQDRVGRHGRIFRFPKFRSMVVDAERRKDDLLAENQHGGSGVTFKMKRDPRITPVGAWLRRFSLDELPQLWCVFRGDMSLVGPRPAVPREVRLYTSADRRRLLVIPGLTCIWQVSGRAEIPFPKQVELDWEYIQQQGLTKDVELLLKTIPAVLGGRGAY